MKKLWKFVKIMVCIIIVIVIAGCIVSVKHKDDKPKDSTYIWPDNELTAMLIKPESKSGKITYESKNTFSIDIYKTSEKAYQAYVEKCKDNGFSEDYTRTENYYSADHLDGYSLGLSYNDKKQTMNIRISKKTETTTEKNTETEDMETEQMSSEVVTEVETTTEESTNNEVTSEFKELMDSYEEFFDSYVNFMNKYNAASSDDQTGMLSDYADFMAKYADYMKKLDDIDEENLSAADYAYYIEVQARIMKKLSELKV